MDDDDDDERSLAAGQTAEAPSIIALTAPLLIRVRARDSSD